MILTFCNEFSDHYYNEISGIIITLWASSTFKVSTLFKAWTVLCNTLVAFVDEGPSTSTSPRKNIYLGNHMVKKEPTMYLQSGKYFNRLKS